MATKAKTPIATLIVLEHSPTGTRARHTLEVWLMHNMDERAERAETLRAHFEATTGNPVVVVTHAA